MKHRHSSGARRAGMPAVTVQGFFAAKNEGNLKLESALPQPLEARGRHSERTSRGCGADLRLLPGSGTLDFHAHCLASRGVRAPPCVE